MFGQEDFEAEIQDENRATLNYITHHIDDPMHDACVFLRLTDCSSNAEDWVKKRHPTHNSRECWVELLVEPEDIAEIRKIMLKLLKKSEMRGW